MGRRYNCWMSNCWCITWPVGFKRLIYNITLRGSHATLSYGSFRVLPWIQNAILCSLRPTETNIMKWLYVETDPQAFTGSHLCQRRLANSTSLWTRAVKFTRTVSCRGCVYRMLITKTHNFILNYENCCVEVRRCVIVCRFIQKKTHVMRGK